MYLFVYIGWFTSTLKKTILEKIIVLDSVFKALHSKIWARVTSRSNLLSAKKNNTTLTGFDLFNFVLLIVYLITYRFSWQTIKANRCLISISKHLYIYISRTYKTVFSYFYWHLICGSLYLRAILLIFIAVQCQNHMTY